MLSVVVVPFFWMLYPISALASSGAGPFQPSHQRAASQIRLEAEEQSKLNGVSTALSSLMTVFGPLWAGVTYDYIAPSAPFCDCGAALPGAGERAADAHQSGGRQARGERGN